MIVFPGGFNWPIWAAQEKGFFAREGLAHPSLVLPPTQNRRNPTMKWTLTTKTQTYGLNTDVSRYEFRVVRAGDAVRVSFENLKPGNVREGHFLMASDVARTLGSALLLTSAPGSDSMNVVFKVDEGKAKS